MEKRIFTYFSLKKFGMMSLSTLLFSFLAFQSFGQGTTCATATVQALATGISTAAFPNGGLGSSTCEIAGRDAWWYSYTATADGFLTAESTDGSDSHVVMLDGACGALNCLGDSDGGGTGGSSKLSVPVVNGTTYYVEWVDRWSSPGAAITWDLTFIAPPTALDGGTDCASSVAVTPGFYGNTGVSGTGASGNCSTRSPVASSWYTYTPTACGLIDIESSNNTNGTSVSVHDGTCAALNSLGCDINFSGESILTDVPVVAGTTYYIEWDDSWTNTGAFNWTLDFEAVTPAPTVNSFTSAGCNITVDFTLDVICSGSVADIEICPDYAGPGDASCVIVTGQTSPAVIDICALGITSSSYTSAYVTAAGVTAGAGGICGDATPACGDAIFLDEGFENGGGAWTRVGTDAAGPLTDNTTAGTWGIDDLGTGSFNTGPLGPDCGNFFVYYESSGGSAGDFDNLNFPATYDFSSATGGYLGFLYHGTSTFPEQRLDVEMSIDGGVSWTNMFTYSSTDNMPATQADPFIPVNIDLAAAAGQAIVDFRFVSTDVTTGFDDIAIDEVTIVAKGVFSPPTAVCQDASVQIIAAGLPGEGTYTVTAAEIDNGSSDVACGLASMVVAPTDFTCADLGANTVTLTVTSNVSGLTASCDATVTIAPSNACPPPAIGNEGGVTFADPCTCRGNGEFDEEVVIGPTASGQTWMVSSTTLIDPTTGAAYATGALFTEIPDPAMPGFSTYNLVGVHLDGVGYELNATSPEWPDLTLNLANTCFYADVSIDQADDLLIVCPNSPIITLSATIADNAAGTGVFTLNGDVVTEIDPAALPLGQNDLTFTFDAGDALGYKLAGTDGNLTVVGPPDGAATLDEARLDPGCEAVVQILFNVQETPSSFACNDRVQISANEDCETDITPDMIMEGGTGSFCYDDYTVTLKNVPNPVTPTYFGRDIVATVMHLPSGNTCWGTVVIEDKSAPTLNCTVDLSTKSGSVLQRGSVINITCDVDPATIPAPEAEDNCDRYPLVNLQSEVETGDKCGGVTLTRTYTATDRWNNESATSCVITINIAQPNAPRFPDDVTWTAQQYKAYSSITDATELHPLIIRYAAQMDQADYCCIPGNDGDDVAGVAPYQDGIAYWTDGEDLDVTLDPLYDDFLQNPVTDTNPACDNIAAETDEVDCEANFSFFVGCPYLQDCNIDQAGHTPNNIKTPIYLPAYPDGSFPTDTAFINLGGGNTLKLPPHPLRGLEDNDVLAVTGSGVPSVTASSACAFAVTHEDQKLEACNGVDTMNVFKIIRTWTVLNWCTGDVFTDAQIIKVLDKKAPVIVFNDDDDVLDSIRVGGVLVANPDFNFPDELQNTELYGNADGYNDLLASDIYSQSAHPDCSSSGLIDVPTFLDDCTGIASVRVYTPAGEAAAVEAGGQVIGYRIPSPYLPIGIHTITFEVMDGCGNTTTVDKRIRVQDGIPPVNICREFTQVALSSEADGLTSITAEHFNEATYDNCGPVWFLVRKMDRDDNCSGLREDNRFRSEVNFCCENIGDTVTVVLRAYDVDPGASRSLTQSAANANDCMVQVYLEDKARPTCAAPEDVWVNCDVLQDNIDWTDVDQMNDLFGTAVATDNCDATALQVSIREDVDLCGIGTVTRTFRAEDTYGNRSLGTCNQTIMIMPVHEYTLNIPGDFEEECDDASPATVTYDEVGCDLIAINIEDEEFPVSDQGECKKILRTYQIIDWCLYDGQSDAVEIPRLDINNDGTPGDGFGGSRNPTNYAANNNWITTGGNLIFIPNPLIQVAGGGYHQYQQFVKIFDNTAPDVSYDGDTQFCGGDLNEDPCTGPVNITVDTDDLCTGTTTRWELSAFTSVFTAPDFNGDGSLTGRYPLGTHTARFYVSDECGNTSEYDVTFEVIDCKAPTPACYNGLSIDVMPLSGMVEIWAKDFDASSFDYCHPIKFEINRVTDQNGDGFIDANDYQATNPGQDSVQFTCADVGTFVYVQMWVGEVSADNVNNWDYCVTTMEVQDNNGACGGSRPATVAGTAKTAEGATVTNVDVTISGAMDAAMTTDNSGAFNFSGLVQGNDYSVTPMRTDDVVNGVSTFDLTIISKHILNVQTLDSPYKMIAADANNSGNISTLDLIAIRKVILRVADEFPNNTSWRFVDKDQILDANPLTGTINEVKNFNDIVGDVKADFIAVKVGDVNGDAEAQDINGVDGRTFNGTFFLNAEDASFEAGDKVEVTFTSDELTNVEGYQFTMNFNTKVLDLADVVEATAKSENFGLTMVDNGIITTSWNGAATNNEAFTLVFVAKAAGTLSNELSVSSEYTVAEAYANGSLKNVGFDFGTTTATADFALYQNTPNPFENETSIGFNLPEAATATITLTDVSGKVLRVIKGDYAKGLNQISLEMTSNLPAGVVIYELETSTNKATRKMTVVK